MGQVGFTQNEALRVFTEIESMDESEYESLTEKKRAYRKRVSDLLHEVDEGKLVAKETYQKWQKMLSNFVSEIKELSRDIDGKTSDVDIDDMKNEFDELEKEIKEYIRDIEDS